MKRKTFLYPIILVSCMLNCIGRGYALPIKTGSSMYTMSFTENRGQIVDQNKHSRNDIKFTLQQKGVNIFIGTSGFHYQWAKQQPVNAKDVTQSSIDMYRMDVTLVGANKNARIIKEEQQESYKRYYLPQTPDGVLAHNYNKITYKNIYPNIDWVLYVSASKTLKYDFVVHEGGNPADIRLQYDGATSLKLNNGSLEAVTPLGGITEGAPYTYLRDGGTISSGYKLEKNVLSFDITGYYAQHKDLVIDPTIDWCTYFGGGDDESGFAVSTDTSGNAYMVGHTKSSGGIATTGAFKTIYSYSTMNVDGFIAKYNTTGVLLWATYYGGSSYDNLFYVATDTLNCVYAGGITESTSGIATSGSYQGSFGGGTNDAYLVKFDGTGARIWATYFGGGGNEADPASYDDYMVSVAWDHYSNRVYLCGNTASTANIATSSSWQSSNAGTVDGYLAQFNSSGTLQWSTYLGGSLKDKIVKAACDGNGVVYITGYTNSTGLATSGAHQTTYGGSYDAFIAKFNISGSLQWSTYYGGSDDDAPQGIASDASSNVYVSGTTLSNLPGQSIATTGSFQPAMSSASQEAFLVKLNSSGVRQWGTYFGGPGSDLCSDIAIDGTGNVCFCGTTNSNSPRISTPGAYQYDYGGSTADAFIAIFGPGGNRTYVTYFGGAGVDFGTGISYSRLGDLFISGYTSSSGGAGAGGIATSSANQPLNGGNQDGFLAKLKADTAAYIMLPFSPLSYCQGDSIRVPYGVTNPFDGNNTFTLEMSDASGSFSTPTALGSLPFTGTPGTLRGVIPATLGAGTGYRIRIKSTKPAGFSFDNGVDITIKQRPAKPTFTSNSPICVSYTLNMKASTTTTGNVIYAWTGPSGFTNNTQTPSVLNAQTSNSGYYVATLSLNGCSIKDSVLLSVNAGPTRPIITANSPLCSGDTLKLHASSTGPGTISYLWKGPVGFTSITKDTIRANADVPHSGYYVVTATAGICSSKDSIPVIINKTVTPSVALTADPGTTICINDSVKFTAAGTNGGTGASFRWYINGQQIPNAFAFVFEDDTPKTNDVIRCIFTSTEICLTKPADTQDVTMTVVPPVPPQIVITSNGTQGPQGYQLMFVANPTYGGNKPSYKWLKNGILISGANKDTLRLVIGTGPFDLKEGDTITCELTSDLKCTNPKQALSNQIGIGPNLPGVSVGTSKLVGDLQIFPNPNNGNFTIKGKVAQDGTLDMQLINAIGQLIDQRTIKPNGTEIDQQIKLGNIANGVYMLRVRSGENTAVWRLVIDSK